MSMFTRKEKEQTRADPPCIGCNDDGTKPVSVMTDEARAAYEDWKNTVRETTGRWGDG